MLLDPFCRNSNHGNPEGINQRTVAVPGLNQQTSQAPSAHRTCFLSILILRYTGLCWSRRDVILAQNVKMRIQITSVAQSDRYELKKSERDAGVGEGYYRTAAITSSGIYRPQFPIRTNSVGTSVSMYA
jgi:hypothetical protein